LAEHDMTDFIRRTTARDIASVATRIPSELGG